MANINGNGGDNTLNGTGGADTIRGRDGNDILNGRGGNDRLFGGSGSDELNGGSGNDTIDPGTNDLFDFIIGSRGSDTIIYSNNGPGGQELWYRDLSDGISANINGRNNTATVNKRNDGRDIIEDISNPLDDTDDSVYFYLHGTDVADTFTLELTNKQWMGVRGNGGNDTFNIVSGFFRIDYRNSPNGIDVDLASGTAQDGQGGRDTFNGDVWEIRGSDNDDVIRGSGNDESFISGAGDNIINGRGGFDRLRYDRNDYGDVDIDLAAGTATKVLNGITYTDDLSNLEWVRGSREGNDTIAGTGKAERFEGEGGRDTLNGRGGSDKLEGEDGNDTLRGGGGRDELRGGDDNDKIFGQDGNDKAWGDDGKDTLEGGDGNDQLRGGDGGDRLEGGKDNDRLLGNDGGDRLIGDAGNDILNGGDGRDKLTGNGGNDDFIFAGDFGDDIITDFNARNSKEDIDLSGVSAIRNWNDLRNNHLSRDGNDVVIDDNNGNTIRLEDVRFNDLGSGDFLF